jgi:hypothetical protein
MEWFEVETMKDLELWVKIKFPNGAIVSEGESGIIINTGLESSMGGYLSPIGAECAYCESGIAEIHNHEKEGDND